MSHFGAVEVVVEMLRIHVEVLLSGQRRMRSTLFLAFALCPQLLQLPPAWPYLQALNFFLVEEAGEVVGMPMKISHGALPFALPQLGCALPAVAHFRRCDRFRLLWSASVQREAVAAAAIFQRSAQPRQMT
jgi:hypothetical protein